MPLLVLLAALAADPPSPDVTAPPAYSEFLIIPLRVHVLSCEELPEIECKLTDADIPRIIGKVNKVWHPAGVHWGLQPILREPAAQVEQFKEARDDPNDANPLRPFRLLAPKDSRSAEGIDVYYIHKFSVNGVYFGNRTAFVQDTAKLRPVEGGIDEPIPRVTAHELGHSLGLPHRQDRTNLLASGMSGTLLNQHEVETARKTAKTMPGFLTTDDLRKKATDEKDPALAKMHWTWLSEIPGDGAAEARAKLEGLKTP